VICKENITIGVDARTVFSPERRGTGKNLVDLYRQLAKLSPEWRFVMYYEREGYENPFADIPNIEICRLRCKGARWNLWEELALPWAAKRRGLDILHCPAQTAPRWKPVPTVVTVHDIIPLRMDDGTPAKQRLRLEKNIRRTMQSATHVFTVSEFSRQDIMDCFGHTGENLSVLYWAPDRQVRQVSPDEIERVLNRYQVAGEYVFAFGSTSPRKNTPLVIDAFAEYVRRNPDTRVKLLLSGIRSERFQSHFLSQVKALGLTDHVKNLGFVDDEEIPALLSGASLLLFMSLYEGFGLPLLDAMACGTPILCSDVSSLPEVAGRAAEYADPNSVSDMASSLERLLSDSERRAELSRLGRERVAGFTWEATARAVVSTFETVMSGRHRVKRRGPS